MSGHAKLAGIRRRARQLVNTLEHGLMPMRCVFCGVVSRAAERFICSGCDADLPRISNGCCGCGMAQASALTVPCAACQADPMPFARVVAPLAYEFPVDAAIKAFKFQRKLFYVPAFTDILIEASCQLPTDIDAVLPVPLHRWRKLRRGYNQAMELARPVAKQLGLPIIANVSRRVATPYQSGLDAKQREHNLRAAFQVRGRIDARHVLLVDDVMTTGATCRQLAGLLARQDVKQCSVLVLARAQGDSGVEAKRATVQLLTGLNV